MKKFLLTTTCLSVLAGCSLAPDYQRPDVTTPAKWSQSQEAAAVKVAQDWWTNFNSPELNALMTEALNDNLDLKASVQRIEQSRAALKGSRASLFPSVNASVGANQSFAEGGDTDNSWNGGVNLSYEADLFGAVRSAVSAGEARLEGTIYTHEALRLVVMSDVAQTYFNLLAARSRLATADQNLKNAEELLRVVQARFDAGADSALEVAQQKSTLESTRASRASLQSTVSTTENALNLLLGKPPLTVTVATTTLDQIVVPAIDAGVPSDLLRNRPDIRAAETTLVEANANIGAARAALYPSVTLGSTWSVAASSFGDPATSALALAASLAAPIFQGGRLEAGVEQATARQLELMESYRQTVLTSFREVEDALVVIRAAQTREIALGSALTEAQKAYDLSEQRYKAGAIDFQALLDAQRTLFSARDTYLQVKNERLAAAVTLFKAVGGGWTQN